MFASLHGAQILGEEDGQGKNILNHLTKITGSEPTRVLGIDGRG